MEEIKMRARKEILGNIDEAVKSPAHSPGEEQRRIDLAVLECLLDIRDGVNYMMESQKKFDQRANAEAARQN